MSDVNISEAAVTKATGKSWSQWLSLLDKAGAKKMDHKARVSRIKKERGVSQWWQQMIAVEYERRRHLRKIGQAAGAGYQIGVTKTLPISRTQLWDLLLSPTGRKLWLGSLARFSPKKGTQYKTKEGTVGEIRSLAPSRRIRLTWQPKKFSQPSTLQLTLMSRPSGTSLGFHQEKLTSASQRQAMRKHWQTVATKLEKLVN